MAIDRKALQSGDVVYAYSRSGSIATVTIVRVESARIVARWNGLQPMSFPLWAPEGWMRTRPER